MFVLFGIRRAFLKSYIVNRKVCPSCKEHNCISYNIYRSHFHIFWIPMFPLIKSFNAKCTRCYSEFVPKDVPDNLLKKTKGKKWQFTGTLIILALTPILMIFPSNNNKMDLLGSPQPGDKYKYKVENKLYSIMLVDYSTKDSVYVFQNNLVINKIFRLYKIDEPENYPDQNIGFSKKEIIKMGEEDVIYSVKRAKQ